MKKERKTRLNKRGLSIVEAIVAMAVIIGVSAAAISCIESFSITSANMNSKNEAVICVENALEVFKATNSYFEYRSIRGRFVRYIPEIISPEYVYGQPLPEPEVPEEPEDPGDGADPGVDPGADPGVGEGSGEGSGEGGGSGESGSSESPEDKYKGFYPRYCEEVYEVAGCTVTIRIRYSVQDQTATFSAVVKDYKRRTVMTLDDYVKPITLPEDYVMPGG